MLTLPHVLIQLEVLNALVLWDSQEVETSVTVKVTNYPLKTDHFIMHLYRYR